MKSILLFASFLSCLVTSCRSPADWYGDIDLGNDFYYVVDPELNSINISLSKKKSMSTSYEMITDIEEVGFNDNYILAISKSGDSLYYWVIDKTQETNTIAVEKPDKTKKGSVTNLSGPVDSLSFYNLRLKTRIEMMTKTYYRQKLNYEKKTNT